MLQNSLTPDNDCLTMSSPDEIILNEDLRITRRNEHYVPRRRTPVFEGMENSDLVLGIPQFLIVRNSDDDILVSQELSDDE